MYDLVIKQGTVVTASSISETDIGISGEKIVALGPNLSGRQVIDATNKLVTPGAVDIHVHLQMPIGDFISADDFFSGTRAAAFGGTTTIIDFVEAAAIPTAMFGMLQALPHTALWHRLEKEGRLQINGKQDANQSTLMNFVPTRPIEEIASEYIEAFWTLYDAETFLDRTYRCFLKMGAPQFKPPFKLPSWVDVRALGIVLWRQGFKRSTRWKFWHHLFSILKHNPAVWEYYLTICAHNEHFLEYREIVRAEIENQLAEFQVQEAERKMTDKIKVTT